VVFAKRVNHRCSNRISPGQPRSEILSGYLDMDKIRNFSIIAHVDHGKSTLADRFLELTKTVSSRKMRSQYLDQMPLEREKGVTIKLAPVTMLYEPRIDADSTRNNAENFLRKSASSQRESAFILNLIDTPGHIDFHYEVSRSLAAVEGAILLVDASQGIQAQTITNLRMALEHKLVIIPVLNKIDLPGLDLEQRKKELAGLLNVPEKEILFVSAKTGQGVEKVLKAVIERIPPPRNNLSKPLRALIFDSFYSEHRGVIVYLRVFDGVLKRGEKLQMMRSGAIFEAREVGILKPELASREKLETGEIGYLATGLREIKRCRVGDTVTIADQRGFETRINADISVNQFTPLDNFVSNGASQRRSAGATAPLPGYAEPKPMVFSSLYNQQKEEAGRLGKALEKLQLNDPSFIFKLEHSVLGLGYNCGFLGLFHLEIVKERLTREYNLEIIVSRPMVAYRVWPRDKKNFQEIHSPAEFPVGNIEKVEEPVAMAEILTPAKNLGNILNLIRNYQGEILNQHYLSVVSKLEIYNSLVVEAKIPLRMIIVDFYDKLKNISAGFASLSYEFLGYQEADLVRLDILVAGIKKEMFSSIVHRQSIYDEGKKIVKFLKENLPRQLFEVKIQAAVGNKIVATERLPALRKDVTAKLYGGDVTRKKKLLTKQKRGKKRLLQMGKVDIPTNLYLKMLKKI